MSLDPNTPDDGLQFDQADFAAGDSADPICAACSRPLDGTFFQLNTAILCRGCGDGVQVTMNSSSAPLLFIKAAIFGVVGGAIGSGIYYAILALTGYEVGLVAIAVGWLVASGIQKGNENRGGLLYQLMAVAITYTAIVSTYVPLILKSMDQTSILAIVFAFLLSFAVPFLAGFGNIISWIIIGIALWQAWSMTRKVPLVLTGPHQISDLVPDANASY